MDPRRLLPALLTIAVVCLSMTLGVVVLRPGGDGGGGAQALTGTTPASPRSSPQSSPRAAAHGPADVLRAWDRTRARAWARGDGAGLARLYVPGSHTGAADVAALRRWTARDLRVIGLRTQVLEITATSATRRRLHLVVTDRLVGGVAVGERGVRVPLPVDRASTRAIAFERVGGRWLVAEVRPG
ncbi:hypothetical protein EXE58_15910 [Nocardioides seonyuensis]|uniref:Uncharacterized protein n=1 Tax=Nocardioides seonyuensis TaxID=2518371 RepID=A0A4P7IL57_9ACTN|nr:hypothetical protein [Nocardioides seonyuensis]QBX56791.1 hypothetical protein EXE58_15910 [Nocardioides seonyuensis]